MVQTPIKPLTLEAFLELPETKPTSEYIDGEVIQKPMPQGEHSTLQGELIIVLNGQLRTPPVARAYPELRCTFGDRSVVPDVVVFRSERIPRRADGRIENVFLIAPDWTIEILSPGQSSTKVVRNISHCLNHGATMGWLVDAEEGVIFVYDDRRSVQVFEALDAVVPVPDWAGVVNLTVGEIFSWLTA
jgi:Uma2 family endonuclease